MLKFIIPLTTPGFSLELAGGKGANLCKLVTSGFPVPPGFIITTNAYRAFVSENNLEDKISNILGQADPISPQSLESTSNSIRAFFSQFLFSPLLGDEIRSTYQQIGASPVAVRSSATAEDLPDLSFAGQQDTYLNVIGSDELLDAVRNCWGSLWTARAIGYRFHHHIDQKNLSLAVVVQQMVNSEISGVAFTANPLNGIRKQTVINATLGLGEALVSGKVDADQYVIDQESGQILSKSVGAKKISIRPSIGGGTFTQEESPTPFQALSDSQILSLTQVCQDVANIFKEPQDIEWAISANQIYLLQSRPITSLFPLPIGVTAIPLRVFGSFAAVQGVVNPITPLGQQTLMLAFIGGAQTFGYHQTLDSLKSFRIAGERIWSDITPIIRNSVGQKLAPLILSFVEPTMRQAVLIIVKDPRLQPDHQGIRFFTILRLLRFFLPVAGNIFLNMVFSENRRKSSNRWIENLIQTEVERNLLVAGERDQKLMARIKNLENMTPQTQRIFPRLVSLVATGMAALNFSAQLIDKITTSSPDEKEENSRSYLELTRGLPHNVTTEMDLALWSTAQIIKSDPESYGRLTQSSPEELVKDYAAQVLPVIGQKAINEFLSRYQLRGIGEIDIGRERWKDNPLQVFQTLQSYTKIIDPAKAPDAIFSHGAAVSASAQQAIIHKLGSEKHGWIKKRIADKVIRIYRSFGGLRETPKFTIIHLTGAIRMGLMESGEDYVRDGILDQPDDLFFLKLNELKELASGIDKDWKNLVKERRMMDDREKSRRQIPRLFLSDGQAFYEGMVAIQSEGDNILTGSPVSPGVAEGYARIILDPQKTMLLPGEILVCPGTDPAWTPLFLAAGGLVMEVGGLMTHGAVVAREYGIPAVVGVDKATQRILTGQKIRVNGSTGQVEIIPQNP